MATPTNGGPSAAEPTAPPPATTPPPENPTRAAPVPAAAAAPHASGQHKRGPIKWIIAAVVVIGAAIYFAPSAIQAFSTVSTDDAYVNGHLTLVAPRVAGQVAKVFVDDNNRVKKGDLLFELDKEPYQVQVDIAQSAVDTAQADFATVQSQTRAVEGQVRGLRFSLQHAIEDVDNQVALLRSKVATLQSEKASLAKAQGDYDRALPLVASGGISADEIEQRKEALLVAQAKVQEGLEGVYQVRVSLGLPAVPVTGNDLTQVPADLDQTFSTVKQAQAVVMQGAAQLNVTDSFEKTPKEMIEDFYKRDAGGNIDRIYAKLLEDAPAVKQAQARLMQAQRALENAQLNLRYCDVVAEIDGAITQRNINPGNNVVAGESVMAIRSLTDIWVDANFKETQLADLAIGQAVDLDVDMYGSKHLFKGRISGFTIGTGSTLALLPAENATGNFVKVVQRLPVRIEVVDYDPDTAPLFIGLSVTPHVLLKEPATGPDAGKKLQPYVAMTQQSTTQGAATQATTMPAATAPTATNP